MSNKTFAKLTPEQQKEKLLKQLSKQERLTITDFATFGKIKSWGDFQRSSGIVPPKEFLEKEINVAVIKEAFAKLKEEIQNGQDRSNNDSDSVVVPAGNDSTSNLQRGLSTETDQQTNRPSSDTRGSRESIIHDEYSIVPSLRNNPKVQYNKQQELAAADIVRRFMQRNHYSVGFPWPVGTGKTYVFSAVISELYRRKWRVFEESVALYPVLVVTRATIVEQTERVLRDQFDLVLGKQVDVTNIDQLRAGFGENFLKQNINVVDGIEHVEYEWIAPLSPALIILDESQSVKNPDSTQSKIFQKYNELDGEEHRILFSSATMFTRVVESKVFAVSTRLEW